MSPGAEAVSLACWPQSSPREGEGEVTQTPRPFLLNKNLRPLKGQAPENHYNVFSSHKAKNAVLPVDWYANSRLFPPIIIMTALHLCV